MKYYRITAHTPFIGEDNDYYLATDNENMLHTFADECIEENCAEWMDQETLDEYFDGDEEAYYADCYTTIREISLEEYKNETEDL